MPESVTVLGGRNKRGEPEALRELTVRSGEIYSIVGFTGSGKSRLIGDIEQMAQGDTVSGRRILVDGQVPSYEVRYDPRTKLVAQLSQNMNFALEMRIAGFLSLHAKCRNLDLGGSGIADIVACANTLAGEPISGDDVLTQLSGGQSRALMIADIAAVSDSPIVLVDEVENAGIDRRKAMELLARKGKIVLIVTHDPLLALLGEKRVVMRGGGMDRLVETDAGEREAGVLLERLSENLLFAQERIRRGERISPADLVPVFEKSFAGGKP